MLIKETALNYLEGLYHNDKDRVEKAIHPELAKRVISNGNGHHRLTNMGWSHLLFNAANSDFTSAYIKDVNPEEPFKLDIKFFDISEDIASIKVSQNKFAFIDYIHLGKINDQWKIINILWAWTE